ncbi:Kelch repeat-containing protein [Chitinophaga sp. 30R24]|uniref:Kelch repeat-containing protein n=1 Tax=Chitinophaga sp. 30R24 TaxID=3248838 RepID=UPI003B921733
MRYFKGYSLLLMASLAACSKGSDTTTLVGNWIKRSEFEGVARSGAASFVIDDKAYVGTGFDGLKRLSDFWMYNVDQNQWTQKTDFGGDPRSNAVGMAVNGKGYVGTGYDGRNYYKDFYEYDPVANAWTKKADFGGTARYGAVAFSVTTKGVGQGYIATGYDGNWLKDNWAYDPASNTWTQAQSLISGKRQDASVFVINNTAFVCMGTANNSPLTDFYSFNGDDLYWKTLNSIANVSDDSFDDLYNFAGSGAASFAMRGKGYIATGTRGAACWEYNPGTDRWVQKTDFEGAPRTAATGFTVKDRGFVVLGQSNSSTQVLDDMWEFDPTAEYNKND